MIHNPRITALAGAAVLTVGLLSGCGAGDTSPSGSAAPSGGEAQTVVGMTYIPNVQFAPIYVAQDKAFFAQAGAPVEIRHHGSDEGLFTALIAGDEHITIASGDEVLQARAQGAPLVSIGAYYHHYPVEVIVPDKSGIATLKDLRGKRIGIPGEYGSSWFGLLAALRSAGLTTNDVKVVSVGYTQAAALVSGDVDAIVGFSNSEAVQLDQMGFSARAIPLDPDQTPLIAATIVTTQEWLSANPKAARDIVAAITRGTQAVIDSPQVGLDAAKKWDDTLSNPAAAKGALATLNATIPLWTASDGNASATQDLARWEKMGPFLAEILGQPELAAQSQGAATNDYAH